MTSSILAALAAAIAFNQGLADGAPNQPHIVTILADDMGWYVARGTTLSAPAVCLQLWGLVTSSNMLGCVAIFFFFSPGPTTFLATGKQRPPRAAAPHPFL